MKLRLYSKYKFSGIEWLWEIPEHWEIRRLKNIARFAYGDPLAVENHVPGDYDVYGSNGIVGQHNVPNTKGPCLIVGRKGSFGKVTYSEKPCFAIDTTYFIDTRYTRDDLRWLYYCLQWLRLDSFTKDSAVPGLAREDAYENVLPYCSIDEQRAIATFLDRETARIDKLIKKKERQIELLKEKRAAVISHAVTKGLDPNVKMKDSGIEWLGEIPEHWEVKRLKNVVQCLDGHRIPLNAEQRGQMQGEYPYWGANGIVDYVSEWLFDEDLVLLGEDGAPFFERFKDVAFFVRGKVWVNNHIHVLRPLGATEPRYLVHVLNITDYGAFIDGTTRDKLTQEKMNNIPVLFPPTSEQCAIAKFLDRETARIDALIEKIRKSIDLLREYRSVLITAAVTGKIDVRGR